MLNLSHGAAFTWQISASEAAYAKYEFIEKEHLFIGLCKVSDLLKPDVFGQIEEGINIERLKAELGHLNELFVKCKRPGTHPSLQKRI